jgi:hypothetical protein
MALPAPFRSFRRAGPRVSGWREADLRLAAFASVDEPIPEVGGDRRLVFFKLRLAEHSQLVERAWGSVDAEAARDRVARLSQLGAYEARGHVNLLELLGDDLVPGCVFHRSSRGEASNETGRRLGQQT